MSGSPEVKYENPRADFIRNQRNSKTLIDNTGAKSMKTRIDLEFSSLADDEEDKMNKTVIIRSLEPIIIPKDFSW